MPRLVPGSKGNKQLWTCLVCGRQFLTPNKYHSCGFYSLEDHFKGKDPSVRDLYDALLEVLEQFGPIQVFPVKTCIIFQAEVQFAAAIPHRRWLEGYLWLKWQAVHPAIRHIEMGIFRDYGHIFRLSRREDLDEKLISLPHKAYILGILT